MTVNGPRRSTTSSPARCSCSTCARSCGLTGTKIGCDTSSCGACTVLVDGESVKSCTMLAAQADGAAITTIEGLANGDEWHPVQTAFHENHGLQCGYCTAGHGDGGGVAARRDPEPDRARRAARPRGQPLPLHRLPQHREVGARRGGDDAGRQVIPAAFDYVRAESADEAIALHRRARRRRQVPRGRHVAAAADEAAARDADGARRRRPRARPLVRPRRRRPRRDRRARRATATSRPSDLLARGVRRAARGRRAGRRQPGAPPRHDRRFGRARRPRVATCRPRCSRSTRRSSSQGPGGERDDRRPPSSSRASSRPRSRPTSCSPRSGSARRGANGFAYQKFNRRAQDWAIVGAVAARVNGGTHVALVNMGSTPLRATAVEAALAQGASAADAAARSRRRHRAAGRPQRVARVPRAPRAGARAARARGASVTQP